MPKPPILLTDEIVPLPALIRAGLETLPGIIRARDEAPAAVSSNSSPPASATATGAWLMRAVKQFFDWCDERLLELADIEAIAVAT